VNYAKACGSVLALAHAKSSDAAAISRYLGSSDEFDEVLGNSPLPVPIRPKGITLL
jgi:hypothetical protein